MGSHNSLKQQRKSRAKKIKGIRQALLPVTYILPSAALKQTAAARLRGAPDRRSTPPRPAGEVKRHCLTPGGNDRVRHGGPAARSEARPQPWPPPHGSRPRGPGPYLSRAVPESFPGEGRGGSAPSLPKPPAPGGREATAKMIQWHMDGVPSQRKMPVLPMARLKSSIPGEQYAGLWGLSAFRKRSLGTVSQHTDERCPLCETSHRKQIIKESTLPPWGCLLRLSLPPHTAMMFLRAGFLIIITWSLGLLR
ncbi:uncharacterized protein [Melopsittacus undulatus]|uniref:uncharacterized protein n=1 Tax=Melopsittacus undulatus TaxID=13146 RepID=UPI00146B401C|nr:uncharacterized protein LOC117436414 [Melopsittacus undulatus]